MRKTRDGCATPGLKARQDTWKTAMKNKRLPTIPAIMKKKKLYWTMPKREARLVLSHNIGELNFKINKKQEMTKKYGNLNCFAGCDEVDSLSHAMSCVRYDTKVKNFGLDGTDEKLAKYLTALDSERSRKYKCPLVYRVGGRGG